MYFFPNLGKCCSMSGSNCCFLTCIQISQEAGKAVWSSHLLEDFQQFVVIHRVKGFGIVNKAEIDVFLELSCFFDDTVDVGNLISGSSAFSKSSLNIWKFSLHKLLKPGFENFEHYFTSVWDECNCDCALTYMQSTSWETLGWKKHKLESRLPGEISITSDTQMTPPFCRKWRGTKKPLDGSERGEWKSWLKAQHSENEDHGFMESPSQTWLKDFTHSHIHTWRLEKP